MTGSDVGRVHFRRGGYHGAVLPGTREGSLQTSPRNEGSKGELPGMPVLTFHFIPVASGDKIHQGQGEQFPWG